MSGEHSQSLFCTRLLSSRTTFSDPLTSLLTPPAHRQPRGLPLPRRPPHYYLWRTSRRETSLWSASFFWHPFSFWELGGVSFGFLTRAGEASLDEAGEVQPLCLGRGEAPGSGSRQQPQPGGSPRDS